MKRYEARRVGVFDRELNRIITPKTPGWYEYTQWLKTDYPDMLPTPATEPIPIRKRRVAARATKAKDLRLRDLVVNVAGHDFSIRTDRYADLVGVGVLLLAGDDLPAGFTWVNVNNQAIQLTLVQVRNLLRAMTLKREQVIRRWGDLMEQIEQSETPETIDTETGWPL